MTLQEITELATAVCDGTIRDERPDWLKAMPGAVHPREPYYHFFYEYAKRVKPSSFIEIGTRGGTTAIHVAFGHSPCRVTTVDVVPGCKPNVEAIASEHGLTVLGIVGEAQKVAEMTPSSVDMLFVDGDHTRRSSYSDYLLYRSRVRDGGMIFFDDTRLSREMTIAWEAIMDPKVEIPELHYMGFGVAMKKKGTKLLNLTEVLARR